MNLRRTLNRVFSAPFLGIIWIYQKGVSPFFPASCRFWPSCSEYSKEAFQKHGFFWGIYLTFTRLSRCNPFCEGGIDKVPDTPSFFKNRHHG